MGFTSTSAKEIKPNVDEDFAPCSIRYEVFVNGNFSGYHTTYNYSLSCSGQGSGRIYITYAPIYA